MNWQSLSLTTDTNTAVLLSEVLPGHGALSISLEDADPDTSIRHDSYTDKSDLGINSWKMCTVRALFPEAYDIKTALSRIQAAFAWDDLPKFEVSTLSDQDWLETYRQSIKPIKISQSLWVVPTRYEVPNPHALSIRLDPGLAFGTGSHPTTRMCLQWMEDYVRPEDVVLDYGCGTGILAIAARKIRSTRVVAVDNDPQAMRACAQNAEINNVTIERSTPEQMPKLSFSLIAANIHLNPLIASAQRFSELLVSGGRMVVSGIVAHQVDAICKAYQPWCKMGIYKTEENWVCMAGTKQ